jgi:hypothetical protein
LVSATRAVSIWQRIVEAAPDRCEPDLAIGLGVLGEVQLAAGVVKEAATSLSHAIHLGLRHGRRDIVNDARANLRRAYAIDPSTVDAMVDEHCPELDPGVADPAE